MSLISYQNGQTGVILVVKLRQDTTGANPGNGKTALTFSSTGLIISTRADTESSPTVYTSAGSTIETITTLGTFATPTATKCRFKLLDNTNHPGVYEIQLDNTRYAVSSAKSLLVSISGVSGLSDCDVVVPLLAVNPYDVVRGGMTAFPAVVSGNAGAVLVDGTGTAAVANSSGKVLLQATQSGVTIPTVTTLTNAPTDSSGVTTLLTRIGGSITISGGKVAATLNAADVTGNVPADLQTIKTQTVTCSGGVTVPAATLASTANITAGTITTVTNLTNLPAIPANWLTAAGIAAAALNGKGDWSTYAGGDTSGTTTLLSRIGSALTISGGKAAATVASGDDADAASIKSTVGVAGAGLTALAPAATALSTATWTSAMAGYLSNLNVGGNVASHADVTALLTTAMTESYPALHVAPTPAQALWLILQYLLERTISGTTETVKKLDGSTTAYTETLNDSVSPTARTRAT